MKNMKNVKAVFLLILIGFLSACWKKTVAPSSTMGTIRVSNNVEYLNDDSIVEDISGFELQEDINPFENMTQDSQKISLVSDTSLNEEGISSNFKNIYFNYDQYSIREDQVSIADYNLDAVKKLVSKGHNIIIEGHACDSAGTAQYNMILSEDRAKSIAKFFIDNGIPKQNIKTVGFGCQIKLIDNGDKEQQAPNRRVEIKVDLN